MKQYNVAIFGATGAVGMEMLKQLLETNFPFKELHLFASERSADKIIAMHGQTFRVKAITKDCFQHMDIVFCAVDADLAKQWVPEIQKSGAIVIDNSSAFRLDPAVPLIIPEINPEDIQMHHGIIANPNCATIIALTALAPLHRYASIKRMIVSTYQAVSGAGAKGMKELLHQIHCEQKNKPYTPSVFPHPIAFNIIPQIGDVEYEDYTSEEMKMEKEGRKILHKDTLSVNCTCVRIPVYRSHSESIWVEFEQPLSLKTAKALLEAETESILVLDDTANHQYPTPLLASNQNKILVGRIRKDLSGHENALSLWCCGDQLCKGAATNAIQIAWLLVKDKE